MNISSTPITFILIALNCIVSFMALNNNTLMDKTILWPIKINEQKQWYRFITAGFIHADLKHLIFNMLTLYFFGTQLELYFQSFQLGGGITYLLLYFTGLVFASIPSYIKNKNNYGYRALGASGAVSAIVFGCVLFAPWSIIYIYVIPMPFIVYAALYVGYCVYMSKRSQDNIGHDAHLWGSIFGLVFTLILVAILKPVLINMFIQELTSPHFNLGR
jgi:membrane associated rhomboid family serine protease